MEGVRERYDGTVGLARESYDVLKGCHGRNTTGVLGGLAGWLEGEIGTYERVRLSGGGYEEST